MAGVLDSVNQRTQLVGQNRLELLLFRLDGNQLYGINVFKVEEYLQNSGLDGRYQIQVNRVDPRLRPESGTTV